MTENENIGNWDASARCVGSPLEWEGSLITEEELKGELLLLCFLREPAKVAQAYNQDISSLPWWVIFFGRGFRIYLEEISKKGWN